MIFSAAQTLKHGRIAQGSHKNASMSGTRCISNEFLGGAHCCLRTPLSGKTGRLSSPTHSTSSEPQPAFRQDPQVVCTHSKGSEAKL